MRKLCLILILVAVGKGLLMGQDNIDKRLKNIEGPVKKITITTDEGEVTFEGAEAKELSSRLRSKKKIEVIKIDRDTSIGDEVMLHKMHSRNGLKMIILDDDTLTFPLQGMSKFHFDSDSLSKSFSFNCDSAMGSVCINNDSLKAEIKIMMKDKMKNLHSDMKSLKKRIVIIDDDECEGIECNHEGMEGEHECTKTEIKGKKPVTPGKKKVIIKKIMIDKDGKESNTEEIKEINNE